MAKEHPKMTLAKSHGKLYCSMCDQEKNPDEFRDNRTRSNGKQSRCKTCSRERFKSPDAAVKRAEYNRNKNLKMKYGIDDVEYRIMLKQQSGVCLICKKSPPRGTHLSVDHDHETGEVRGLLCKHCNFEVAVIEKPGRLKAILHYLKRGR